MTTDFSIPQKQSKTGVLVFFFYALIKYAKAFLPIILVSFLRKNSLNPLFIIGGVFVIVILIAIYSYLKYINFTFYLDQKNNQFIISEGILTKTITSIQLNKIQQVNIDQSFLHKLIGTFELSIDSAGSSKNEGNIKAISQQMAIALKNKLLQNDFAISNENHTENETINNEAIQESFVKIKLPTLIKIGLTSSYGKSMALILVFLITIFQNFAEFLDFDAIENFVSDDKINKFSDRFLLVQLLFGFIILSLLIVIVVNLFRIIFKFFNFDISKQNDSMLFSYGLLNSKNIIINFKKVQIVSITQNYFQKKMLLSEVAISHASALDQQQNNKKKSLLEIPGCNNNDTNEILKQIFKAIPETPIQIKPNFRKLAFSIFTFLIFPISVFYGLRFFVFPELYLFDYFTFVYGFLGILILTFAFRNYNLFLGNNFVRKQSGAWDKTNEFIEIHKIQAITTSQLFWHKNLNIGTLKIHTAGGDIKFELGNFETIKEYVNIWLYEIEKSNNNWM